MLQQCSANVPFHLRLVYHIFHFDLFFFPSITLSRILLRFISCDLFIHHTHINVISDWYLIRVICFQLISFRIFFPLLRFSNLFAVIMQFSASHRDFVMYVYQSTTILRWDCDSIIPRTFSSSNTNWLWTMIDIVLYFLYIASQHSESITYYTIPK